MKAAVRQGDVLLKPATIPTDAKKIALRPIALGERTGHHHSLMSNVETPIEDLVEMYEKDGQTFVRVLGEPESVSLVHQQHKAHTVAPAEYVYVPQVENSDWGTHKVID
jgi:hypothetical protein